MKILVFSLDTEAKSPSADEYNTMTKHMETGKIIVTKGVGVYKGREETSLICLLDKDIQDQMIMAIAHAYKQESVLEVELPSKKGYLRFIDGKPREYVGTWKEIPPSEEHFDNFTLNLDSMKAYKCYPDVDNTATA